jgi:hypothetical protein
MGFSAAVTTAGTGSNNTRVTESFDLPNVTMTTPFSVSDSTGDNDGVPEPGESVLLNIAVTNITGNAVNGAQVSVNGGTPVSYGNLANGATVSNAIPYTIPANAQCGSLHQVSIVVSSELGAQNPQVRSFRLGSPIGGLSQNFDGVTAPALPAGWTTTQAGSGVNWVTTTTTPDSAPNSAFTSDPATTGEASLVSPDISISSASAQLTFRHRFVTEAGFDGGVLEISIAGAAFQDILAAGGSFVAGAYTGPLGNFSGCSATPNPLATRQAWNGNSNGYITTTVNLPASANGQSIKFRWRMGTDCSVASTGWNIDNVEVINGFACSFNTSVKSRADFDGDGKTDLSVFRPSEGNWYLNRSTAGFTALNWGLSSDVLTPGDFDGDGKTDVAVFRGATGTWFILRSSTGTLGAFPFGAAGDVPVVGDYDGDDKDDAAVFRPSTNVWYILNSGGGTTIAPFGAAGDIPVRGDYDGDGKTDIAVYRAGQWWIAKSTGGTSVISFGIASDKPVPADYDGDDKDDVAVYRNGIWYILRSTNALVDIVNFGIASDVPAPGDYDGDGKDDQAVYRDGVWWLNRSTSGPATQSFGLSSDTPVPTAYIP